MCSLAEEHFKILNLMFKWKESWCRCRVTFPSYIINPPKDSVLLGRTHAATFYSLLSKMSWFGLNLSPATCTWYPPTSHIFNTTDIWRELCYSANFCGRTLDSSNHEDATWCKPSSPNPLEDQAYSPWQLHTLMRSPPAGQHSCNNG